MLLGKSGRNVQLIDIVAITLLLIKYFKIQGQFVGETVNIAVGTKGRGTAVAQWLRCFATNRKVAGSIPASVRGFFIDIKSFRSHYGPGVDSASNRNEHQEYFLVVKAAGA